MKNFPERYMLDLMHDRRNDILSQIIKFPLLIFSYIYGFFTECHHFFYRVNLLKSHKVPAKVASIGNITLGGTGKTPFSIMLARRISSKGEKVALLTRGYGDDEWRMLKETLAPEGTKVFVGRDRVKNAKEALKNGATFIILDDGFQHLRLARDLDIVLLDSTNPFGNRRVFPRGILRERCGNLRKAGMIVLTKTDMLDLADRSGDEKSGTIGLENEIRKMRSDAPIVTAFHRPTSLLELKSRERKALSCIKGKDVCIFSAICDPDYFRHTVLGVGARVGLEFTFPDHYAYKKEDLESIFQSCEEKKIDLAITTEKDSVKLTDFISLIKKDVFALQIELAIRDGEDKLDAAIDRLHMCRAGKSA